jgi:hypothetical protein
MDAAQDELDHEIGIIGGDMGVRDSEIPPPPEPDPFGSPAFGGGGPERRR